MRAVGPQQHPILIGSDSPTRILPPVSFSRRARYHCLFCRTMGSLGILMGLEGLALGAAAALAGGAAGATPASVAAFREQIRAADALLIASPEYNASVSGVRLSGSRWTGL